jgi:hypothetical protein
LIIRKIVALEKFMVMRGRIVINMHNPLEIILATGKPPATICSWKETSLFLLSLAQPEIIILRTIYSDCPSTLHRNERKCCSLNGDYWLHCIIFVPILSVSPPLPLPLILAVSMGHSEVACKMRVE